MTRARHWAILLLAVGLVLALASGLAACGGPADGAPPPPESPLPLAATPEPAVSPGEPPATATPPPAVASSPPPAPDEPPVPDAPAPPAAATSEPAAAPVESSTGDPSAATDEAEAMPFRYDTYDRSGAVAEPGHYAFLADPADPASVVMTYEELRDGTATTLRIHTHDAHGILRADLYDAVKAGDLVEWRQAADCWVRYQVTDVKPDPSAAPTRWWLGVEWITYAFTGCSGPITEDTAATFEWGDLPNLGGPSLTAPVIHGPFQIVPANWTGIVKPFVMDRSKVIIDESATPSSTTDLTEARKLPYWRDPTVPAGMRLLKADAGDLLHASLGYEAFWVTADGYLALQIAAGPSGGWNHDYNAVRPSRGRVNETRIIAGRPAMVGYTPNRNSFITVRVHDPETGIIYVASAHDWELGKDFEAMIAIARSLFEPPNPP